MRGPLFNKNITKETTRDNLGINSVFSSMTADLCPVINTVTPSPFYWTFLSWVYYDAHENAHIKLTDTRLYREYIRRQEFYMILACVLAYKDDEINKPLNGKDNVQAYANKDKKKILFEFYNDYYGDSGGMNYYTGGLATLKLFEDTSNLNRYPHITELGKKMALAFEYKIKDTRYYKEYRLGFEKVPKNVLIEYAQCINASLIGFDECKGILRDSLFSDKDERLHLCYTRDYLLFVHKNISNLNMIKHNEMREILYEKFAYNNKDIYNLSDEMNWISRGWELAIGRQYFALGVDILWSYLLKVLNANPMNLNNWINEMISYVSDDLLVKKVSEVVENSYFSFEERENTIEFIRKEKVPSGSHIIFGIKMMMEVYNRFYNQDDLMNDKMYLDFLNRNFDNLSLIHWFEDVNNFKDKSVKEFLMFLLENYCIKQHLRTAKRKMYTGRDGYYIEEINGCYYRIRGHGIGFQGNRIMQFIEVMKTLDMLSD